MANSSSARACRPTGGELTRLLDSLGRRIVRLLEHRGMLILYAEHPSLYWMPDTSLDHLQAASVSYRIAIGPHAGRKAPTRYSVPPLEVVPNDPLLARLAGFSLHTPRPHSGTSWPAAKPYPRSRPR